ncbi:hypothetical protein [Pirellulimonas nuda]|nr:hypothetical protein [Pirellulimonas nuda]
MGRETVAGREAGRAEDMEGAAEGMRLIDGLRFTGAGLETPPPE